MRILAILLVALLLVGCGAQSAPAPSTQSTTLPAVQGADTDEVPIDQTQPTNAPEAPNVEVEVDFSDLTTADGEEGTEEEQRSEDLGDAPQANKPEVILPEETLPQESEGETSDLEADGFNSQIIQP